MPNYDEKYKKNKAREFDGVIKIFKAIKCQKKMNITLALPG